MFDVQLPLLPMNSETPPSSDPLFGNNPSDLMREAMDPATRIPTGDPRY
jgi:hypothetical protein